MYGLLPILEFFLKNSFLLIPYKKVVSLITGSKSWLLFQNVFIKINWFFIKPIPAKLFYCCKNRVKFIFRLKYLNRFFYRV